MRILSTLIAVLVSAAFSVPSAMAQDGPFIDWLNDFRPRLEQSGASPQTVSAMLDGLEPEMRIIDRDRDQPEFVRPLWEYLDIAASDLRTANGLETYSDNRETLEAIETRFGVDAEILVAIWGLESSYGQIMGDNDVVQALATLAWEGRRRSWAEAQLIAVGRMLDRGYASREQLTGSWAGAMGQTQFIPETYLARAVDFDGDGRRDIWTNNGDAVGSSANLLAEAGWSLDAPIAIEVRMPDGYDLSDWAPRQSRLVAEWSARGIVRADGIAWATNDLMRGAKLVLPAGLRGPAFLTFGNFEAIKRYNNSTSYAIGVWLLSRRVDGGGEILQAWPTDDPPITRSQTRELQESLLAMGYDPGGVDGIFGPNSRRALMAFQRSRGLTADGYAGRLTYDAVMSAN